MESDLHGQALGRTMFSVHWITDWEEIFHSLEVGRESIAHFSCYGYYAQCFTGMVLYTASVATAQIPHSCLLCQWQ